MIYSINEDFRHKVKVALGLETKDGRDEYISAKDMPLDFPRIVLEFLENFDKIRSLAGTYIFGLTDRGMDDILTCSQSLEVFKRRVNKPDINGVYFSFPSSEVDVKMFDRIAKKTFKEGVQRGSSNKNIEKNYWLKTKSKSGREAYIILQLSDTPKQTRTLMAGNITMNDICNRTGCTFDYHVNIFALYFDNNVAVYDIYTGQYHEGSLFKDINFM